jgi:nondiscriminating aspartyl-tRNA synthetase
VAAPAWTAVPYVFPPAGGQERAMVGMDPERSYSRGAHPGKRVLVKGWVAQVRNLGGLRFFLLRDREGLLQVTLKKGREPDALVDTVGTLNREDCLSVTGRVVESKQAPGGKELIPDSIEVVSKAGIPLPIETSDKIRTGMDKRFDYRFIDVRSPKIQAIFRIRDRTLAAMRDFFASRGFVEVTTPVIQAAGAEGGATLFPLIYYKQEAFLRQSPQLYKQMLMASGLDRVYEIGPAFRAEKFHTRRHVSEFVSVDFEMAWIETEEDVMRMLEGMVHHSIREVRRACKPELDVLEAVPGLPEIPFERLTYDDVLKLLEKKGVEVEWGEDLDDPSEKTLGEALQKKGVEWYFISKYPSRIKPFYIMTDGPVSRGVDLDFRGMEMASGGQREHRPGVLADAIRQKGLDPERFTFYLDAFRYGMPPHGGIGFGVERMVQQMIGLENIKETILFPRTPERLVP